ncbi:MAG: dolichol monophosphate mannose synthase [Bdellovibrionales bacterium RIFCSPHIGHO2_01_FULL_40_29]|nr:MAG: dolichol monophosphate mannose synthase [Bdellovibrionales bacterium RIFCSPHIGHO2_01_FULL_40_29]OFZ34485.1 MAG: dolichol monophosphate mannose synthase [Bdellovibrionales bacterium RIFCSPHIGHO2_02_FULL_40_15]
MKKISIVSPCYNEEQNVELLYEKVKQQFAVNLKNYEYEHIFIDNFSDDETPSILRKIASKDKNVKVIFNSRNFGHIRSPFYGLLQATGDATMLLVSDLQDPPELIPEFVKKWEQGYKIVAGVKNQSEESRLFFFIRRLYYKLLDSLSEVRMIRNYTGFGIYDRSIIELLKSLDDPYPFFRGLICEFGFDKATISYIQPIRKRGFTKNNLYTLYDIGILGLTSHSKKLLRLVTLTGFMLGTISLLVSIFYFSYKLIYWDSFTIGIAPVVFGLFFFSSVQLFFLGIIGEYIGNIYTKIMNRPIVVERERVNF